MSPESDALSLNSLVPGRAEVRLEWREVGKGGDKMQIPHGQLRVKLGGEGVPDGWEGRRVFCGVIICSVFKSRAPWGEGGGGS